MTHKIQIPASFDSFSDKNLKAIATKDAVNIFPNHYMVKNCVFSYTKRSGEDFERKKIEAILEANLSDAMARVGEIYGQSANDMQHLFPAVLRMLKSDSDWSK